MSSSHVSTTCRLLVAAFLRLLPLTTADDEFDCVCCFSITHNFCQTAPADDVVGGWPCSDGQNFKTSSLNYFIFAELLQF